jgi:hypothetical protein
MTADQIANPAVVPASGSRVAGLASSIDCVHDELRAIKRYLATRTDRLPWLFLSERGQPLTRSSVHYLVRVAGERAGLQGVHPHMLRHSCGYYLADKGTDLRTMQDYLGHGDPRHTVHYTRVPGRRFEGLWKWRAMACPANETDDYRSLDGADADYDDDAWTRRERLFASVVIAWRGYATLGGCL